MSTLIKQIKKPKTKLEMGKSKPYLLDTQFMVVWNQGFSAGVKQQRESDINFLLDLLEGLEEWPGIGEVTANKIREHFLKKFGQ